MASHIECRFILNADSTKTPSSATFQRFYRLGQMAYSIRICTCLYKRTIQKLSNYAKCYFVSSIKERNPSGNPLYIIPFFCELYGREFVIVVVVVRSRDVQCLYQPCNEGVYLLFYCARPGRCIAEVEHHTYFQLSPGDLPHISDYQSCATHTLS